MLNTLKKTGDTIRKTGDGLVSGVAKAAAGSPGLRSVRGRGSGAYSAEVLDGRKVRALLAKDEKEFIAFLDKYFDLLDQDKGGSLSRDELKPALVRFGALLGLPAPGTASEAESMVDRLFTSLMAEDLGEEVDRATFINISKNFLTSVASGLEEKPLVVHVFDGTVLRELVENEDLFEQMVNDFFRTFDEDGSGFLARDEILPALAALGLVPPTGAKPEADALLSQILGKYGGTDLQLDRKEFKQMLRDIISDLSAELKDAPLVVSTDSLPVMTAPNLRKLVKDPRRLASLADTVFVQWDTLKQGRITQSDVMKGFKELCSSYQVPILDEEQAAAMCLSSCIFMNADADATGFVERQEFDSLLEEILGQLAERLEKDPSAAAAAATQSSAGWLRDWWKADSLERSEEGGVTDALTSSPGGRGSVRVPKASSAHSAPSAPAHLVKTGSEPTPVPSSRTKAGKGGRSAEEIKAAYNYKPSEAVLMARQKVEERQKKVRELADKSEELDADAANFEDLATQLNEKMKKRWW